MKKSIGRWYKPWLLFPWIWHQSSDYQEAKKAMEAMMKVTGKVLEKYREKLKHVSASGESSREEELLSDTMIEVMLRNGVEEKRIFDEVAMMLAVANDTTPLSTEYALFMLALHPEHQERCREEIDRVYNDSSKVKNGTLEFEALKQLKYLERCVLETLRINPLTILMRRLETNLRISNALRFTKKYYNFTILSPLFRAMFLICPQMKNW